MAKYTVQSIKLITPMPDLLPSLGTSTILGEYVKGWSAVADEDIRMIILKVRKQVDGKLKTKTYRLPFETVQYYEVTASRVDEADLTP